MNLTYITTPSGIVRILEWIFGMVAWCCVVSNSDYSHSSNLVYGVTVLIIFWLLGLFWLIIHIFGLTERLNFDSWPSLNFGVSCAASLLIFIGFITIAVDSCVNGVCSSQVQAGAAFAFFAFICWTGSSLLAWKEMTGKFCWQ